MKKIFALILVAIFLCCNVLFTTRISLAEEQRDCFGKKITTRATQHDLDDDFSFINVLLGTNGATSISVDLCGAYYIQNNLRSLYGTESEPYRITVSVSGSKIKITHSGTTLISAKTVIISRVNLNESGGYLTINGCTDGLADGRSYLGSLNISVNDNDALHVINVVPTAHYLYGIIPYEMSESCDIDALRAQAITSKSYAFGFPYAKNGYDITDSMNYQGYRGYKKGYTKCMQACLDVCGEILSYNSKIELTFYGATNGGETDKPANVFGFSSINDAYEIKIDDIDFEQTPSKRQTLEITYGEVPQNDNFCALVESEAKDLLGYDVELISVDYAIAHTPQNEGSIRNLTRLQLCVKVKKDDKTLNIDLDFDITKLKSAGVFTRSYKIYWSKQTQTGCEIYFCRYGHGLGLSQYGAQARALAGNSYKEILEFYFSKFDLNTNVTESNPERPYAYTQEILAYGVITGNSVNFRSGPGTSYSSIMKLDNGQHLDIVGADSNGWLICIVNGCLGYVSGKYVDIPFFPSPENGIFMYHQAVITNTCSAYDVPGELGSVTATFYAGETVTIRHIIGEFYYITSKDARKGFISSTNASIRYYSITSPVLDNMHMRK